MLVLGMYTILQVKGSWLVNLDRIFYTAVHSRTFSALSCYWQNLSDYWRSLKILISYFKGIIICLLVGNMRDTHNWYLSFLGR